MNTPYCIYMWLVSVSGSYLVRKKHYVTKWPAHYFSHIMTNYKSWMWRAINCYWGGYDWWMMTEHKLAFQYRKCHNEWICCCWESLKLSPHVKDIKLTSNIVSWSCCDHRKWCSLRVLSIYLLSPSLIISNIKLSHYAPLQLFY